MPQSFKFTARPVVYARNDQRNKADSEQETAYPSAAVGFRQEKQTNDSSKARSRQGRDETGVQANPRLEGTEIRSSGRTETKQETGTASKKGGTGSQKGPTDSLGQGEAHKGIEKGGPPQDRRKQINENKRRQLEEARKRAVQVRQEKAQVKRQEKELRDALFEQKKREIQEMKDEAVRTRKYNREPQYRDPPSPKVIADTKPRLPSPFKRGSRPRLPTPLPDDDEGRPVTREAHPDEHETTAGSFQDVLDDQYDKHTDKKMKIDHEDRTHTEQTSEDKPVLVDVAHRPVLTEQEKLKLMEEEMLRDEEERLKLREEYRAALRKEARDKHMAELEAERRKAAENIYRKKMDENRIKLLTQQVFGV